jgi:hypothetical protein
MKRGPMVFEQLVKDDWGMWKVTVRPTKPDSYGYNLLIDGEAWGKIFHRNNLYEWTNYLSFCITRNAIS